MRSFLRIIFILFSLVTLNGVQASPIDINKADAELMAKSLRGIGIKKAELIIAYRAKHGPFKTANDLVKVKGIGQKTVAKNRNNIQITIKKSLAKRVKTSKTTKPKTTK